MEELTPFEKTCKMIGEKYGPSARQLLARIQQRKENDRIRNSENKTLDKSSNRT